MATIPIVDTHLHVWDTRKLRYPWLDTVPLLNKPYLLADYRQATAGLAVERMVFVQCECDFAQYADEVAWVTQLAQAEPRIQGIVAWAPLEKGERARAELTALARNPLLKGIRRIIQFEADLDFCLRPDFIKGVQLLAEFGLHFELCIKADRQFANALTLVRQCPQVRFILDHIGKPFIQERIRDPWRSHIQQLAALPNTWCKMSGFVTEADHPHWTPGDLQPYADVVLEAFGWERVMFGGDWPVVTLASPYTRWVETLQTLVSGATPAQLRQLFHDNACKFYRLP